MAERKPARKATQKSTGRSAARAKTADGFSEEERAAMRERAREQKAARSRGRGASEEEAVLERLAGMPAPDRALGERLHALIRATAPELAPKLWYGMPAYAKDGAVVCFFQAASKFKTRYATLGFSDKASLDDGTMWPTVFGLTELTPEDEARIRELVQRAVR